MSHFIRGYFAGDGSINYRGYTICFVGGSESFFTSLDEIFSEKGYNTRLKK
ncbi:LAGLIDADG family homing endonuclease [Alteribacter populi]|uniref:LAGLIDADG family homing endonuclease n=1 Tax=Alteribacter populi TaxID=2011011 RepID=UPI001FDFB784|nr:LAGLIDADG family homing endonuclease [Alteribacter populi]